MVSNDTEFADLNAETDLKLRDRYLLERDRIKNQIGELSQILQVLGVNQRRACQLLLVDPSAWTRWNKTEAPPHIYQALKWLVMLKKTNPNMFGSTDIETRIDLVQASAQSKIKELERNVASLERTLAYQPTAISSSNDYTQIIELFRAQEERLQKQISELEMEVKKLSARPTAARSSSGLLKHRIRKPNKKKFKIKTKSKPRSTQRKVRAKRKSTHKKKNRKSSSSRKKTK